MRLEIAANSNINNVKQSQHQTGNNSSGEKFTNGYSRDETVKDHQETGRNEQSKRSTRLHQAKGDSFVIVTAIFPS
jgi:hypothetical protein